MIVLYICLLFWDDFDVVKVCNYLMLSYFDYLFMNFSMVVSYSGLVVICVLCVSCG